MHFDDENMRTKQCKQRHRRCRKLEKCETNVSLSDLQRLTTTTDTVTLWRSDTVETPKSERTNFNFQLLCTKAKSEQNAAQKLYLLFTFSKWKSPFLINEFEFGSQFASDATWNGIFRWSQHEMFNWIVIYIHSTTPVLWVLDGGWRLCGGNCNNRLSNERRMKDEEHSRT